MNIAGLTDSIARLKSDPEECPLCHTTSRIAQNLCLGCLLQSGTEEGEGLGPDEFKASIAALPVKDAHWRLGNYEILEEIGRGGMGVIYRARQRHSRRVVALKRVLSYHADSRETLARFRREAEAAASLDHPNILPIYEVGETEEAVPYFSMKYAAGGSLQEVGPALRENTHEIVRLMAKVTRAVAYAHEQGILHRDLKPGNILLDGRGEPLVSDFGLAKWLDTSSDLTRTLTIYGTPGYIAPEQAEGNAAQVKPAADVYSLGAILFELLAGRPPFLGEHALAVIRQAAETGAPKLRALVPSANRDLETICARCLERDPEARYQSATELAEDLERWLDGRPIVARPVSLPVQVWRWSKRNPAMAAAACACFLLALGAIGAAVSRARLDDEVQRSVASLRSVGILPFEDLDALSDTGNARQLQKEIAARLPSPASLTGDQLLHTDPALIHPLQASEWRQIGRTLGVSNLLAGTVRSRGGLLRATFELVDANSGLPLRRWLFENSNPSVLAAAPAENINAILKARAQREEAGPTSGEIASPVSLDAAANPLARDYFAAAGELKERYNVADLYRSIELSEKSVATDPKYARAYAQLATSCLSRSEFDGSAWVEKGIAAARKAIELAPMLSEAQRAYAGTFRYRGQMHRSIDSFLSAYELDPLDHRNAGMLGNLLEQVGQPDLALRWLSKAQRLESRPGIWKEYIAEAWLELGEDEKAARDYARAITFRPDLSGGDLGLARLALLQGNFAEARRHCGEARKKFSEDKEPLNLAAEVEFYSGNFPAAEALYRQLLAKDRNGGVDFFGSCRFLSAIGYARTRAGDARGGAALLEEARALDLKELQIAPTNLRRLYDLAANEAVLQRPSAAFAALESALAAGWIDYRALSLDPRFTSLREKPRFQTLVAHLTEKVAGMRAATRASAAAPGEPYAK